MRVRSGYMTSTSGCDLYYNCHHRPKYSGHCPDGLRIIHSRYTTSFLAAVLGYSHPRQSLK
uniref:chitin binding peritrophin-A domain-containing protein n=2 Tax=Acinetobacter radioresistens TaxID=40216 RepID=UPI00128B606A